MSIDELEALLLVQEHDTARDRLRHRRAALPERAELETQSASLRALDLQARDIRGRRDVVLADEKRLDDEARSLGARADDGDAKLYSGTVSSPRELQAMQADVEMLRRQRSDLEDQELEVMEARELLDAQIAALAADTAVVQADIERLQGVIAGAESEIDEELAKEDTARAQQASAVPDALLADYERRRAQNKGAGAARLVGTSCTACHLSIPSTEAENIRKGAGAVVAYCDNCGAILVP
ncbi:MAG TPA: C4-type zinc ribbon domain-containing protein [Acidimicrobiia bacterium]|nr:C4-type zinc ribbon domain-containing protein [Acidimicrobiia bacterium]